MSIRLKRALESQIAVARSLRREERVHLDKAALLRIETRLATVGVPDRQMARILKSAARGRVRRIMATHDIVRSPVEGANDRFVKHALELKQPEPSWIDDSSTAGEAIHIERTVHLRRELRAAYLAYCCLKGLSLETAEERCREPIPFGRVKQIVDAYADMPAAGVKMFEQWQRDAEAYQKRTQSHPAPHQFDMESKTDKARYETRLAKANRAIYSKVF